MNTSMDPNPNLNSPLRIPFSESIKRIGEQARNWEFITDFGTNLDVLKPSAQRRRFVIAPWMIAVGIALIVSLMGLQTAFFYSELRAQRATIEQLQTLIKALPAGRSKSAGR